MKAPSRILASLLTLIALLLATNTWLWVKNQAYRQQNRELILQNDSTQSVNIKLSETTGKQSVGHKPHLAFSGKR